MTETTGSLREFFGTQTLEFSPGQREKLQQSLRAQGQGDLALRLSNESDSLAKELDKLLDIGFGDIFAAAWNKARELRRYTDQTEYPPEQVYSVPLLKHTIESAHKPALELLVNNQPVAKLTFEVSLECELEGFELQIQAGKIMEIKTGAATGTGKISCEDFELLEKQSEPLKLPGRIRLGEGVPIPAQD